MNKKKILLILVIIVLIVLGSWLIISKQVEKNKLKTDGVEFSSGEKTSLEDLESKALIRWQTNCDKEGGVWINDDKICFKEEIASEMKSSCELFNGNWLKDSLNYECEIKGDIFKLGQWQMINFDAYEQTKNSCLDLDGEWIGGIDETCKINGNLFYLGVWNNFDEIQISCVDDFKGEWLGGEKLECVIDGETYPGNWAQVLAIRGSCKDLGGIWLDGDDNACRIEEQKYTNQSWEKIAEMEESCKSVGGEYIGGDRFNCNIEGDFYFDKSWEKMTKAPSMQTRCAADGGTWGSDSRSCLGLSNEWCMQILVDLNLEALGWNEERLACYIY